MRRSVDVIPVTDQTLPAVLDLWAQARVEAGAPAEQAARVLTDPRLAQALARPDIDIHVAFGEGHPVGFAVTSTSPFGLSATPEIAIEQLWVTPEHRRGGVARALLGAVLASAERATAEVVVSNVPSTSRDANRFFARLGFGSVSVRRVTSVAGLRRRLAPESADPGLRQLLLLRRRSVRSGVAARPTT